LIPMRCRARTAFKAGSAARPINSPGLAVAGWFEHPASRIGTVRSLRLSYATFLDFVNKRRKWSGQEDSNLRSRASEARALARLSYTLMAARRGYDPLSPVRQTGRLTRCVTGRGVHGAVRTPTCCVLDAVPLPIAVRATWSTTGATIPEPRD
jgi:hypothetical protein